MTLSWPRQIVLVLVAAAFSLIVGHGPFVSDWPEGDENHYLLAAHSLARDGDLDLRNNHHNKDGAIFGFKGTFPHSAPDSQGRWRLMHPPGVVFLAAGPYCLAGAAGAYLAWALLYGWLFLEAVKILLAAGHPLGRALWVSLIVTGSPVMMLTAARLFPALPAGLCLAIVARRILEGRTGGWSAGLALGLTVSFLPWLHPRLTPAALVAGLALIRSQYLSPNRGQGRIGLVATIIGAVVSGALFLYYQDYMFGDPLTFIHLGGGDFGLPKPMAEFYANYLNHWGPLGLLFDQEYGLAPYALFLLLVPAGVWLMFRDRDLGRWLWLVLFGAVYLPGSFYSQWTGAFGPPARFAVAGLMLAVLPLAKAAQRAPKTTIALGLLGGAVTVCFAFWPTQWSINDCLGLARPFRNGPGWVYDLHNLIPSFTRTTFLHWLAFGLWLALIGYLTGRLIGRKAVAVASAGLAGAVLVCLALTWPGPALYFDAFSLRALPPEEETELDAATMKPVDRQYIRVKAVRYDVNSQYIWDGNPASAWSTGRDQNLTDWLVYKPGTKLPLKMLRIEGGLGWRTMPFGYRLKLTTLDGRTIEPPFRLFYRLPRRRLFFRLEPGLAQEIHFLNPVPTAQVEIKLLRPFAFSHWTVAEIAPFGAP